jgi:26S proteasome regulatory subunit N8
MSVAETQAPVARVSDVVVHPLVLLSCTDHYHRVARDSKKRVVGVLLGETYKGRVDITNSFAGAYGAHGSSLQCRSTRT